MQEPGRQREALDRQVEAMATGPEHSALIEACRQLADTVDRADGFDDKLWREYRLALTLLQGGLVDDGSGDDLGAILDELRAKVDNTEDG